MKDETQKGSQAEEWPGRERTGTLEAEPGDKKFATRVTSSTGHPGWDPHYVCPTHNACSSLGSSLLKVTQAALKGPSLKVNSFMNQ